MYLIFSIVLVYFQSNFPESLKYFKLAERIANKLEKDNQRAEFCDLYADLEQAVYDAI